MAAPKPTKKWVGVYPIYFNKKKTVAEGRRVALDKAIDMPSCKDIADACVVLGLPVEIEVS